MEKTAKDFKDYELEDDSTDYGGISFIGETLEDFLESVDLPLTTPMSKVNKMLEANGIEKIAI